MLAHHGRTIWPVGLLAILALLAVLIAGCEQEETPATDLAQGDDVSFSRIPEARDDADVALDEEDAGEAEDDEEAGEAEDARDAGEAEDDEEARDSDSEAPGVILSANDQTFEEEVLRSEVPVLVDFTADWCPPCDMLHPILEEVAEEYAGRVKVVQVDVDESRGLAEHYGIRSIPTLFVVKDGEIVDGVMGLLPKEKLQQMLDKHV